MDVLQFDVEMLVADTAVKSYVKTTLAALWPLYTWDISEKVLNLLFGTETTALQVSIVVVFMTGVAAVITSYRCWNVHCNLV